MAECSKLVWFPLQQIKPYFGAYPSKALLGLHTTPFLANIWSGRKWLVVINALAYTGSTKKVVGVPLAYTVNHFVSAINTIMLYARVFIISSHFHPSIVFAGIARAPYETLVQFASS
jgi:hypothetical protein